MVSKTASVPRLAAPWLLFMATRGFGAAADCAERWGDCRQSRCCDSPHLTCYEKDATYAQCRPAGSCTVGLHDEDPVQTPWTCATLSGDLPPASTAAPAELPEDCKDSGPHCVEWAKGGECQANPGYMRVMCQRSCHTCQVPTAPVQSTSQPTTTPVATAPPTTPSATTAPSPALPPATTVPAGPPATPPATNPGQLGRAGLWSASETAIVGAACSYAGSELGGLQSPVAQSPYIRAKLYCGASPDLFYVGAECGACYRLTRQGTSSSLVVQVVNANDEAPGTFNCHATALRQLSGTGAVGPVRISYQKVACDTSEGGPVAAVVSGNDYYTKLVFGNLKAPVQKADLLDGSRRVAMERVADTAQWAAQHGLLSGAVGFQLTLTSGETAQLTGCFPELPAAPGTSCSASSSAAQVGFIEEAVLGGAGTPPALRGSASQEAPRAASPSSVASPTVLP